MLTIAAILAIWTVLSFPVSVLLGFSLRTAGPAELVGMEGDVAVFRRPDGRLERMPLTNRTAA
jgi:hypothetical protein